MYSLYSIFNKIVFLKHFICLILRLKNGRNFDLHKGPLMLLKIVSRKLKLTIFPRGIDINSLSQVHRIQHISKILRLLPLTNSTTSSSY